MVPVVVVMFLVWVMMLLRRLALLRDKLERCVASAKSVARTPSDAVEGGVGIVRPVVYRAIASISWVVLANCGCRTIRI